MTEHTAGPWKANRSGNGVTVTVMTPEGQLLIKANGIPPRGAMDANARLIAAAPELLEACKQLIEAGSGEEYELPFPLWQPIINMHHAIEKAEGQ